MAKDEVCSERINHDNNKTIKFVLDKRTIDIRGGKSWGVLLQRKKTFQENSNA
jgi:hypothetical protein